MPLYDYRCPQCGLEFEVSRPISRATEAALCPLDQTESERIFTMPMTFTRGASPEDSSSSSPAPDTSFSHGHSHGHGPGQHTH